MNNSTETAKKSAVRAVASEINRRVKDIVTKEKELNVREASLVDRERRVEYREQKAAEREAVIARHRGRR